MMSKLMFAAAAAALLVAQPAAAADAPEAPNILDLYKTIHSHPELSHQEAETSALLARELTRAGYQVTDHVGVYADGSKAFGVVGVMKNGAGPTLLIRADMDALPITEETGVAYASHVKALNRAGQSVGVMHACGHDIHTSVLVGVARALATQKAQWRGTLILVGQPSEETVDGAKALLADHLYERFGRPDMVIGLHDGSDAPAGTVAVTSGRFQAGVTSVDVTIRGFGGHGAAPEAGRDPIVLAAQYVTEIQTIVSREMDPQDPAVVTVGSIHGGSKRNIIPDEVKLELTTRYFSDRGRDTIVNGLRNRAAGIALSAGLPPDKAPIVTVLENESSPALYNDPAQAAKVKAALVAALGPANVFDGRPIMPSEDVGVYGLPGRRIPVTYFTLGAANPAALQAAKAAGQSLPGPHTSRFLPDPEPTLKTGIKAMTAAALALLKPKG